MILYGIILAVLSAVFGFVAAQIYQGKTELIHDYHQTKVTDREGYGKAFGKAMGGLSVAMALSAAVSFFGENALWIAIAVLVVGLAAGIIAIVGVQKKYNGGVF